METRELIKALEQNVVTRNYFKGVYPSDIAIKQIFAGKKPWFIIVNTDSQKQVGEHWLVFFYLPPTNLEVFDPLGQAPYAYSNLIDFFNNSKLKISYNTRCLQSPLTNICGAHCLFYSYKKCENNNKKKNGMWDTMDKIINKYYLNDITYNDCMVLNFMVKNFLVRKSAVRRLHETSHNCKIKRYK